MNHLLTSTGISVHENRNLEPNQGVFIKLSNDLFVGNIYPFMFLGCGKLYTIDQCVEFSIKYAMGVIEEIINKN